MKKLIVRSAVATTLLLTAGSAMAAGFGLYEASARGVGMGNGLVGSTKDASANYHNPANLTEMTNISVMVGMTLINPFADCKVNGQQQAKMNAGWFPPPHFYFAAPITKDLVFGFGTYCEFGLGTKYDTNWALKHDTTETTIEQFTFNPNIAYKITEDWSVAFGARVSYLTFETYKAQPIPAGPYGLLYGNTHIKGDSLNCGFMFASQYKVTDKLSLGAVYRSRIRHQVEGDFDLNSQVANVNGDAKAKVILPSSATLGANYDFTKRFRGGVSLIWTEWSTIDHIDFNLPTGVKPLDLKWDDAWRVGFGFEYDFTDAFSGRIGYTYDLDPAHKNYGTTMLPPGDRHIIGFGCGYKFFDNWTINLGYNFIIMESETREMSTELGPYKFQSDNGYSHIVSASVSYSF